MKWDVGVEWPMANDSRDVGNALTLNDPKVLTPARSSMRLRSGSGEVRMLAPVGPFF